MPPSPLLLLTNQLTTGGAERYVVAVSRWFAERGVEVIVAATPGELVDALHPAVRFHPTPLQDVRWGLPLAALRVARLARRYRPAAILANSLVTAAVARLGDPTRATPLVAVAHGWPPERYRLVARPLAVADAVIAVSDDVARRLRDGGLPADRLRVIANGVDMAPFGPRSAEDLARAREAFGAGPDDVVVASVGRFVPQKAQARVIELAARLVPQHPNLRVGLIGWGPLQGALQADIDARGLRQHVRLLVRRSDVPDLLMASDVYLSTSDWEGMPLSTIEAMAAGLPVVATDVEGMNTLIDDQVGALRPPHDLDGLAAALHALLADEPRRLTLGSHAAARARARYSTDVMCGHLSTLLDELVHGR